MAFDLSSITRGKRLRAPKIVVYGPPKIGKSTFAASAPNAVGILTEEGLDNIDVAAFPVAKTYEDVLAAIGTLTLTLKLRKATAGALAVTGNVAIKKPAEPAIESLLFATPEGNLLTEDPRQTKLELKPVAVETKELKQVSAA